MRMRKIFLAEDSSGDAFLFEQALKAAGCEFEVTIARDGAEAVEKIGQAARGQYDVMVVDLNLPRMNGEAVLASIQRSAIAGSLPVVVLTSSDSDADKERVKGLGADHYFVKPLRLVEFYEIGRRIKEILGA
jgi:CheY-like chemotaxis protein